MKTLMSVVEIEVAFPSEWVLLEDPEADDSLRVTGGTVLWHSNDRDEVYRKAIELRPRHSAILYTGTIPHGTAIVL